jgi:hypothetical protein
VQGGCASIVVTALALFVLNKIRSLRKNVGA